MYSENDLALPRSTPQFWRLIQANFEYCRHVLEDYELETHEAALARGKPLPMRAIKYRRGSDEYDQREHFLTMGRTLLSRVGAHITKRQITPRFMIDWGQLMYCHGYVASYLFDDSDDLATDRMKSKSLQTKRDRTHLLRQWLAHVHALPQFSSLKREHADAEIAKLLSELWQAKARGYDDNWFGELLKNDHELRPRFTGKVFRKGDFSALTALSKDGLPPLPKIPDRRQSGRQLR